MNQNVAEPDAGGVDGEASTTKYSGLAQTHLHNRNTVTLYLKQRGSEMITHLFACLNLS